MNTQRIQDDEIDLGRLLSILMSGKWVIILSSFFVFIIAFVHVTTVKPTFVANALIQVEEKQSGLSAFDGLEEIMGGESSGSTEIEVLKSRFVLGGVVDREQLQLVVEPKYFPLFGEYFSRRHQLKSDDLSKPILGLRSYSWGGEQLDINIIYLDDEILPAKIKLKVTSETAFTILNMNGNKLSDGFVGQNVSLRGGAIQFRVEKLLANTGAEFEFLFKRAVDSVNGLRSSLVVSERGKDTGIISLRLEGTDKKQIKETLGAVVSAYQLQNIKRLSEEAERSISFLNEQIPDMRKQLERAEDSLNEYRAKNSSLDMELETKSALNQIVTIESQLNELELKESDINSRYKKDHPIYNALLEQRVSLEREMSRINSAVESLPVTQQKLLRLMRDVEVTNQIYIQLLEKMEELKVIRAGTVGNVRVLDIADVQTRPIAPKKSVLLLMSIVLGGVVGIVIVFLVDFMRSGLINPIDVQEKLNIPNYGVVPLSLTQTAVSESDVGVLAIRDKKDLALEAIRSIRTSLHFAMMESKDNVVMLTGASPSIGKSFISSNLAALISEAGQKVLLVDADLRRGHLNKAVGVGRSPGLSEYLSKGYELGHVIHSSVVNDVDFIATGAIPPNPSELLMSIRFSEFLELVKKQYDIVIIDTPPVLAVTDAMIIGKQVGTTMAVVRHKVNTLREVEQMKDSSDKLGVDIKGYIYNFMEFEEMNRYSGAKYYNYGYYGMDESEIGG